MYIIVEIDPLSQPGCYDIITETNIEDITITLKNIIEDKLYNDTDFLKVNYNKQIIDKNYKKYCDYIDKNINIISDNTTKFTVKYYGYFRDQSFQYQQSDILYNVHNLT